MAGFLAAGCGETPKLDVKPGATSIFAAWAVPTPAEAAAWATDEFDAENRYRGTRLLANAVFANEPLYVELFRRNSRDTDPGVRAVATRGLANHGGPNETQLIIDRLKDEDVDVRIEAARGLQRVHNPIAVEPLLEAIREDKEPDSQVRANAAEALGQYAETRVVEALISILTDRNLAVNRATLRSLSVLTGQNFGFDQRAWLAWYKSTEERFAARGPFIYPVFQRDKFWYEHLPFVSPPPNESPATPAGWSPGVN